MSVNLFQFWGKTAGRKLLGTWHPALCHMVDAGAVAELLVKTGLTASSRANLSQPLGISQQQTPAWLGFLVALHDIGKVSPGFQAKVPTLCTYRTPDWPNRADDSNSHTEVSYAALLPLLRSRFDSAKGKDIALALSGHHGVFPAAGPNVLASEKGRWQETRGECVEELRKTFGVEWGELHLGEGHLPSGWLMMLAGLTSVADWLGSDQRSFPLKSSAVTDLGAYATEARTLAKQALRDCGWQTPPTSDRPCGFGDLFPKIKGAPNEMQQSCERLARETDGPFLLLVEAPMGQGKTEAALWAAELTRRRLGQAGLYYALPTQATSNQMFLRMREFLGERFGAQGAELHLLHGMADFNEAFLELQTRALQEPDPQDVNSGEDNVQAHEWFRARKRGLLAPFAVGTVDQALLAALTTRHMFVRLFGLANKTVVIDEVHAYDAYMSQLLDRLIQWLRALGSNVVLLSATLPARRRKELLGAYAGETPNATDAHYPCVHFVSGRRTKCVSLPKGDSKKVQVLPCTPGFQPALDLLAERLQDGGCAAWLCNTVNHAQEAFQALERDPRFADIAPEDRILFHARFLVKDRLRIEKAVLEKFGKPKDGEPDRRPRKAVIVATQVIEQSLDLDFDVMLTELPPVDLLLQRMGRLHRHRIRDAGRPARLREPAIYWLKPDENAEGHPAFGSSEHVYQPYILLQTWRLLRTKESVHLPEDVEAWVEAVYGEGQEGEPFAQKLKQKMEEERLSLKAAAGRPLMPPPDIDDGVLDAIRAGTRVTLSDDEEDCQKLTRLGEPTISLVCLHSTQTGLSFTPDGSDPFNEEREPDRETVRRLLAHSVRMESWRWQHYRDASPTPKCWADVAVLRDCRLARLRDGVLECCGRRLVLDQRMGVREGKV